MRCGLPSASTSRSSGPCGKPSGAPFSGVFGSLGTRGTVRRRRRARERRLVAEAAGAIDRAEQDLQQMQHPAGLEAVGMRRDAAHGVHRHRTPDGLLVAAAVGIGPRNVERDLLLERGMRQFAGNPPDRLGRDRGRRRGPFGIVFVGEKALRDQREARPRAAAIRQLERADQRRRDVDTRRIGERAGGLVERERLAVCVAREHSVIGRARIMDHQPMRVGEADQIFEVDLLRPHQLMDQRADEQSVGAGPDADPFVGDRAVAGADRIDGDDLDAFGLELAELDLERIGGVILGDAEQHEVSGVLPVRLAELPERAAEGVEPGRRHVDRAEAAVRGEVLRAVLLGEPAGQRLALVAAGEERKLGRVARAHVLEPAGGGFERLVPGDFGELARASGADALQRRAQPRRRRVRHDAGRRPCRRSRPG